MRLKANHKLPEPSSDCGVMLRSSLPNSDMYKWAIRVDSDVVFECAEWVKSILNEVMVDKNNKTQYEIKSNAQKRIR
jgi:hypothetical protein